MQSLVFVIMQDAEVAALAKLKVASVCNINLTIHTFGAPLVLPGYSEAAFDLPPSLCQHADVTLACDPHPHCLAAPGAAFDLHLCTPPFASMLCSPPHLRCLAVPQADVCSHHANHVTVQRRRQEDGRAV